MWLLSSSKYRIRRRGSKLNRTVRKHTGNTTCCNKNKGNTGAIFTQTQAGEGASGEVETAEEQDTGEQNQEIRHQWKREPD